MDDTQIIWDLEDDPEGNVQHIQQHGVSMDEVDEVLLSPDGETTISRSSGHQITFGYSSTGRYLAVVWEHVQDDPLTIRPITAYDAPPPTRKRRGR